jgi:hypothetical protein
MLFYIAGKVSTSATVETGFRSSFDLNPFRQALATNYGGDYTDYYIYSVDETDADAIRIKNGDDFVAVWTGNQITGVSFTVEDSKKCISSTTDRTLFMADNREQLMLSLSILKADKSGVDDAFNEFIDIPIKSPDKIYKMRFRFINGKSSRSIKTDVPGSWIFPSQKINDYRNNNIVNFESIQ